MWSLYGILILVLCNFIQQGSCGLWSKQGDDHHGSNGDQGGSVGANTKPINGDESKAQDTLVGTIKWPFQEVDFEPNKIQSPINLLTQTATLREDLGKLKIYEPENSEVKAVVKNTGETGRDISMDMWISVFIYIEGNDVKNLPYLEGGPLRDRFYFEQMHFHWGTNDNKGSEHQIDGHQFAIEIHMVHFNSKYKDFNEAKTKDDGLAVLTVLAEGVDADNVLVEKLDKKLDSLIEPKSTIELSWADAMNWAISGVTTNHYYYAYPGSLTTSPFSQNVVFIILPTPITISHRQLAQFRGINDEHHHHIMKNRRALQDSNNRPIFKGPVDVIVGKNT